MGKPLVITEKLDGANTLIHQGRAYARAKANPSGAPWMAMTRKHHAWKLAGDEKTYLYGEDIYGVHSIKYGPVPEDRTLYAFALLRNGTFASWDELTEFAQGLDIPTVPVIHRGTFRSRRALDQAIEEAHRQPSLIGGDREGVVVRTAQAFAQREFGNNVAKSVRAGHVQTDRHWTRNWKPCAIQTPQERPD